MRTLRVVIALLAFVVAGPVFAKEDLQTLSVDELSALMEKKTPNLFIYDVNPPTLRQSKGVIPGSHLLPSTQYDVSSELPKEKNAKLVFYCASAT